MRALFRSVAVLAAMIFTAAAVPAGSMTMTVGQAQDLLAGIRQLNRYQKIVKEGDREAPVIVPYRFDPGVAVAIAKDKIELETALKPFDEARDQLLLWWSGGTGKIEPGSAAEMPFALDYKKLQAEPVTVTMVRLRTSDLKMTEQPVPPDVLALINPILDDDGR